MKRVFSKASAAASVVLVLAATALAGGKNLQHFPKDISMEDLKAEMKVLRSSLGVKCDHCHQYRPKRDFSVDIENKKVARSMLAMMDKINKNVLTKEALGIKEGDAPRATCFTCHKGKEKPELKPEKAADAARFEEACKDEKHKAKVEAMKQVVEKLNKDYFTWKNAPKATCWMCHRGQLEFSSKAPDSDDE